MNDREILVQKLLALNISSAEIHALMLSLDRIEFRNLIKRFFDLSQSTVINNSTSTKGLIGFFNKIGQKRKNRGVKRKLDKPNFRAGKKLIVAEGDSWFEFPIFRKDIVDWIIKETDNPVYSLAYGGDWIANMLYEEEYLDELAAWQPEIFMISGGGNDLVGDGRVGTLVDKPDLVDFSEKPSDKLLKEFILDQDFGNGEVDAHKRAEMIVRGSKYLNKGYWDLCKTFEIMYRMLFRGLELSGKLGNMKIITQGYDFVVPSDSLKLDRPLRLITGNGGWLYRPLNRKSISDKYEQRSIMSAMIYHFNEMLIAVCRQHNAIRGQNFIFHIDSRGTLQENDWADELHPTSQGFKQISQTYIRCINGETSRDVRDAFVYPVRKY